MKEDKFINENTNSWRELEDKLSLLKPKGVKKLGGEDLHHFLSLYNMACGHLSYSRTYFGSTSTTEYLNRLVSSAHSYIYATRTSSLKRLWRFLSLEFPLLINSNKLLAATASLLFAAGFLISFFYTLASPDNAAAFLPTQILNSVSFDKNGPSNFDSPILSSAIMTNNIKVGFMAFALGITAAIGTSLVLIYNGFILGSLAALALQKNAGLVFWSLILPHGVIELFAIFICGMAGLIIGNAIINPGKYSRRNSFIIRGRIGIRLVLGTIPLFVIAGLIEGFITPLPLSPVIKLTFAAFTLFLLAVYLSLGIFKGKKIEKGLQHNLL